MKNASDLRNLLMRIDHRGYPAYKDTKDKYQFDQYVLSIDHVQGDPFASPSKVSVIVPGRIAGFGKECYETKERRIAFQDFLLRRMYLKVKDFSFKAKGSGKSGLIGISRPGQEILERSACTVDPATGNLTVRMEVGFPANGRTINAGELIKILFDFLPLCVRQTLLAATCPKAGLEKVLFLADDQKAIRDALSENGLVAFVADGAVLPRKSGVSSLPMKEAVPFASPESMKVTLTLPHRGALTGMGIQKGVTLIVGGGYHGKSTLLEALMAGVYNHIAGDGREYVITDDTAVKLRAEDGRSIDEDTSATNFMIRDDLMQRVVSRDAEPIIPFIDRIREIYTAYGISTILVAGSCGSYFHKSDCIVQMKKYAPMEITDFAKKEAENYPYLTGDLPAAQAPDFRRIVKTDAAFARENRIKMRTDGTDGFSINKSEVDMRYVEQLVDSEQLTSLAYIIKSMKLHDFDGKKTLQEAISGIYKRIDAKGFAVFAGGEYLPGNLAMPRPQELYAAINRCRDLIQI